MNIFRELFRNPLGQARNQSKSPESRSPARGGSARAESQLLSPSQQTEGNSPKAKHNHTNIPMNTSLISQLSSQIANAPIEWEKGHSTDAILMGHKGVQIPALRGLGLGGLGRITLEGTITAEGDQFKCFVRAICLPLMVQATESAESLEVAKQRVEKMMTTQAISLVIVAQSKSPK